MINKTSPRPLSMRRDGNDMVISRAWMRDIGFSLLLFGLLLFGLLLLALAFAVLSPTAAEGGPAALAMLLAGGALLPGGVAALVAGFYNLINRT